MIQGIKRDYSNLFWLRFKKHYCPECNSTLKVAKASKVVNSQSDEAKNYDFSNGDIFLCGNVKFIYNELVCRKCGRKYSVQEIKTLDKSRK